MQFQKDGRTNKQINTFIESETNSISSHVRFISFTENYKMPVMMKRKIIEILLLMVLLVLLLLLRKF